MIRGHEAQVFIGITLALALSISACIVGDMTSETSTAASPAPSAESGLRSSLGTSKPLAVATAEMPTDIQPLAADDAGTWIILSTPDGLWRMRPDGTDLALYYERSPQVSISFTDQTVSPDGRYLALLSTSGSSQYDQPTLTIFSVLSGKVLQNIPLTTSETNPSPDSMPGDPKLEAVRSIVEVESYAWSPDGSRLAFMGVLDGPSSDLYLVSPKSNEITRLTDGPTQVIRPVWSPDGRYIVHVAVGGLGTGAGYSVKGVWAAAADGSGTKLLYEPDSGDEIVDGWLDDSRFVVHSWRVRCGEEDLRAVDVTTGEQQVLWKNAFSQVAVGRNSSSVLVGINTSSCDTDQGTGLLVIPDGGSSFHVLEDDIVAMTWSPDAKLFFVLTEFGMVAISPSGETIDIDTPIAVGSDYDFPEVEPATHKLAWSSEEGVWISEITSGLDNPPRQIISGSAPFARWGPNTDTLFFSIDGDLYQAHGPQWEPVLISESLGARDSVVVGLPQK